MNDRTSYLASAGAITIMAISGAVFSALGYLSAGLALIGVAVAIVPLSGHLRMRRQIASVARSIPSSQASASSQDGAHFQALTAKIEDLSQTVNLVSRQINETSMNDSGRAARDLQRETRALRLAIREIEGLSAEDFRTKGSNPESSEFSNPTQ